MWYHISDNDINGEAFLDLTEDDLVMIGFTFGQRVNILKIQKGATTSRKGIKYYNQGFIEGMQNGT